MDRKGLFPGNNNDNNIPPSLAYYESSQAKGESLYLDSDQFADIISYYSGNGQYGAALNAANQGLEIHPDNLDIIIEKAYAYLYLKKLNKAKEIASELLKKEKNNDILLLNIEITLAASENNQEIASFFLNELEDPDKLETIVDVCYVLLDVGDAPSSMIDEWIDKGLKLYPNEIQFLQVYAEFLKNTNQLYMAGVVVNKLIDEEPYNTYYWWLLSIIYFEREEYNNCKEALEFTIVTDEEFADAYLILGQIYFLEGDLIEAIHNYNLAIEKECNDLLSAYLYAATTYLQMAKVEEAAANFKLAVNYAFSEGDTINSHYEEDFDVMIKELQDELQLGKHEYIERFKQIEEDKLLNLSSTQKPIEKANIAEFEELDSNIKEILNQLYISEHRSEYDCHEDDWLIQAIIALEQNDKEKALKNAKLAEKYSKSVIAYYELATVYLQLNMLNKAKEYFLVVNEKLPNYNDVTYDLALIAIVTYDIENFEKYNELLEKKIDLKAIEDIISTLEEQDKSVMINVLKQFQNKLDTNGFIDTVVS